MCIRDSRETAGAEHHNQAAALFLHPIHRLLKPRENMACLLYTSFARNPYVILNLLDILDLNRAASLDNLLYILLCIGDIVILIQIKLVKSSFSLLLSLIHI